MACSQAAYDESKGIGRPGTGSLSEATSRAMDSRRSSSMGASRRRKSTTSPSVSHSFIRRARLLARLALMGLHETPSARGEARERFMHWQPGTVTRSVWRGIQHLDRGQRSPCHQQAEVWLDPACSGHPWPEEPSWGLGPTPLCREGAPEHTGSGCRLTGVRTEHLVRGSRQQFRPRHCVPPVTPPDTTGNRRTSSTRATRPVPVA
jgi:hypothetical protein